MKNSGSPRRPFPVLAAAIIALIVMSALLLTQGLYFGGRVSDMGKLTDSLESQVSAMSGQTASLESQIGAMSNLTDSLEAQVSALQSELAQSANQSAANLNEPGSFSLGVVYAWGIGPWVVVIPGYNGDSSAVNVTGVEVNGQPYSGAVGPADLPLTVAPGSSFALTLNLTTDGPTAYQGGEQVQVVLFTSTGPSYPAQCLLPDSPPYSGAMIVTGSVSGGDLVLYVRNRTMYTLTVTQIYLNGTMVPLGKCDFTDEFFATALYSYQEGHVSLPVAGAIEGDTYTVTLVIMEGGNFTTSVVWP